ncbi:amidohydrolase [Ekhidna sp. To15]|uniref:amidohydrolase n=1 Tax=Ekhidna sp. To15 TaxID=3395267 RepID=UPI003F522D6C
MEAELEQIIKFRRELHQYPEVSQNEFETQKRIINALKGIGIPDPISVGNTGVIVVFSGAETGKSVMLRADIDALPIQETNDFPHKSQHMGVSHKCGHDGHTAIMYGVARSLLKNPPIKGKVILLFQPAEENGEGAKAVLKDAQFDFEPDFVFAFHNLPGYPLHQVVVRDGSFTAAAKSVILKLNGKTSHAAEPEMGINPTNAIAELISFFDQLAQPDLNREDFALTAPVHISMGEKSYGVTAGYAEVHYTLRSWNNKTMNQLTDAVIRRTSEIARENQLELDIDWTQEFDANQNNLEAVQFIRDAAKNSFELVERPTPFKWGEDFGLFTKRYKGAMFGIGSGENCPALHNPDYDFPDEIIPTGMKMFLQLIEEVTNA